MTAMNYRRLGRSGLKVSELSFGSWVTYANQVDTRAARELMAAAFDAGVNFFEVSFPLNSGDGNDFALAPGDQVGFCVQYLNNGLAVDAAAYPRVGAFNNCMLDANQANYAVMTTSP